MKHTQVLAGAVALAVSACGGPERPGGAAAGSRPGGAVVVAGSWRIQNLSPLSLENRYAQDLQQFVLFTPLLRYDRQLRVLPHGAESFEVSPDTSEITFHLRRDLRWHDGVKTTAADWKFSYDRSRDPQTAYPLASYWQDYGEAEAVDSFTFRVKMRRHADFLDPWTAFAPVPRHRLAGVAPERLRFHPYGTQELVGNGPFRLASRGSGDQWVFEANPAYPAALGGRPLLDRVVFRTVEEPSALAAEVRTGRVDVALRLPPSQAAALRAAGTVRLSSYVDRAYTMIAWNQRRGPFRDPRVRRALTLAVDRRQIVEGVRAGFARVADSPVPPMLWQHDPAAGADLGFDPGRARRLLADSGFGDRDGDGIVEGARGAAFRFTLLVPTGEQLTDVAQAVQADLRAVGVDARIQMLEFNALVARVFDAGRRDFDAVLATVGTDLRIDDRDAFACGRHARQLALTGHCSAATDSLLEALPRVSSRSAALPLWHRYQKLIADDQPYTFLFYPHTLTAARRHVRGVAPDVRGDWVGADRWSVAPTAAAPK